jgi:hypothetical protein
MAKQWISMTLTDDYGRTTTKRIEIAQQLTIAAYQTVIGLILTDLEAVTDLGCVRVDLVLEGFDSGWAVTSGANVDVGGTFSGYILDGDGKKASHKVPGIKPSLVDSDGSIDITGAVATYLGHFEPIDDARLSDGERIDTWIQGSLDK